MENTKNSTSELHKKQGTFTSDRIFKENTADKSDSNRKQVKRINDQVKISLTNLVEKLTEIEQVLTTNLIRQNKYK